MAITAPANSYPFGITPQGYINQAIQNVTSNNPNNGVPVSSNQLTYNNNRASPTLNSPAYNSLMQQLTGSLLNQGTGGSNNIQSLVASLLNNPTQANQVGGFTGSSYTPNLPTNANRLNFTYGGWNYGDGGQSVGMAPLYTQPTPNYVSSSPKSSSPSDWGNQWGSGGWTGSSGGGF